MIKPRQLTAILFLVVAFYAKASSACSCGDFPSFKQIFNDKYTDLVVHARVLGYIDPNSQNPKQIKPKLDDGQHSAYIQIQIIDTLKCVAQSSTMTIGGFGGLDCYKFASNFPTGSEWILALPSHFYGVRSCGEYALMIDGNDVLGNKIVTFTEEKQRIKLKELYKLLGLSK